MKIPFVGPSDQARSTNASAQRSVNCYLEMDNASPRAPIALYGTPGLSLAFTLPTVSIRGSAILGAFAIYVSGSGVYKVDSAYTATLLGTIGTSTGPVGITSNGAQVLIVDGVTGWLATTTTLTQITDVDFPAGVTSADFLDGYFMVTGDGTQLFYINETPNVGGDWNGLDFGSAEGAPDNVIAVKADHREAWMFGAQSIEIYVNTGNADFPLERTGNAFIEFGCVAGKSISKIDNTLFWLGRDQNGEGIVYRANGYTPVRVSTSAIERAMQGYSQIDDAIAFSFQMQGHSFYALSFPTGDATWLFDIASGAWTEWLWRDPSDNTLHRHRAANHLLFNGAHLVGDWETGEVYALSMDTYTDNGDPILRLRATQTLEAEQKRVFVSSLQVDMETGVGLATGQGSTPELMLRYSLDGGHSWSNLRTASVGAVGAYGTRALFRRLGQGRNRVWEISMTDPVKFAVFGAFADVKRGTS